MRNDRTPNSDAVGRCVMGASAEEEQASRCGICKQCASAAKMKKWHTETKSTTRPRAERARGSALRAHTATLEKQPSNTLKPPNTHAAHSPPALTKIHNTHPKGALRAHRRYQPSVRCALQQTKRSSHLTARGCFHLAPAPMRVC